MSVARSTLRVGAMSLIELLCVIAILALLAALLLPAVGQAKARARQIQCINHLHQVGVGFVSFANEHNGQFPMAVPASAGGSLEFARGGYLIQSEFYFSYRHFQAASNELVTPKLLVCPADTRLPASGFATLNNANLSYFIGVNAEFARPASILAGDRNLTNDYAAPGTLVRLGRNYALRWTDELHRFKGNLLSSDGHVEEKNDASLISAGDQSPVVASLALPTLQQPGITASSPGSGSFPSAPGAPAVPVSPDVHSFSPTAKSNALTAATAIIRPAAAMRPRSVSVPAGGGAAAATPAPPKVERRSTNATATATPARPGEESPNLSPFGIWMTVVMERLTRTGMWWLYALLLLVVASTLVLRKAAQGRTKRAARLRK